MTGVGRFVSEDRYMGALADPLSQNRYVYASDNPLRYADPTGRMVVNRPIFGGDTPWSLAEYQENLWAQENDYWVQQRDPPNSQEAEAMGIALALSGASAGLALALYFDIYPAVLGVAGAVEIIIDAACSNICPGITDSLGTETFEAIVAFPAVAVGVLG